MTETLEYLYVDELRNRIAKSTDNNGVEKLDYSTWGKSTADASYTGKERDGTGLYYFNARYYDPEISRFITEDPAKDGLNWYNYAANDPINKFDPDGRMNLQDAGTGAQPAANIYYGNTYMPRPETNLLDGAVEVVIEPVATGTSLGLKGIGATIFTWIAGIANLGFPFAGGGFGGDAYSEGLIMSYELGTMQAAGEWSNKTTQRSTGLRKQIADYDDSTSRSEQIYYLIHSTPSAIAEKMQAWGGLYTDATYTKVDERGKPITFGAWIGIYTDRARVMAHHQLYSGIAGTYEDGTPDTDMNKLLYDMLGETDLSYDNFLNSIKVPFGGALPERYGGSFVATMTRSELATFFSIPGVLDGHDNINVHLGFMVMVSPESMAYFNAHITEVITRKPGDPISLTFNVTSDIKFKDQILFDR